MSFQVLEENEKHFKVKHPDGSHFLVAKKGLDDDMIGHIQGYAQGTGSDGVQVPEWEQNLTPANGIPYAAGSYPVAAPLPTDQQVVADRSPASESIAHKAGSALYGGLSDTMHAMKSIVSPVVSAGGDFIAGLAGAPAEGAIPPNVGVVGASGVPAPAPAPQTPQVTGPSGTPLANAAPYSGPGANPMAGTPYAGIYAQQQQAQQGLEKATQSYLASTGAAMKTYQDQQKALFDSQQANLKTIQGDLDASKDAFMKGTIDPHRLWNNASTGNKIAAGIGLVLGGIGSGLTHQPNQALQLFDNMIDKDIDAQKMNQDKNRSLFQMNLSRYGNQQTADAATRLQMYNGLQAELQQKGLGLQSAQAQANYQLGMAGLQERMIPLQLQLASYHTMQQANSGGIPTNFPTEMLPKDFQDRLVNVPGPGPNGMVKVPAQSKESADEFRKGEVELNNIDSNLQNLKQVYSSSGMSSLIPGTSAHSALADASDAVKLSLGNLVNLKRINEYEAKKYERMLPGPYSLNSAAAMAQIGEVEKFIKNSRNSAYSSLLSNYSPGGIKEGTPTVK